MATIETRPSEELIFGLVLTGSTFTVYIFNNMLQLSSYWSSIIDVDGSSPGSAAAKSCLW